MGYRLDDKEIKKFNVRLIGKGKKGNVYRFHDAALKLFKEDMRLDDFSSYEMTVRVVYAKKVLIKL